MSLHSKGISMLINKEEREILSDLFQIIKLQGRNEFISLDNKVKIEQIIAYLEILHAELRKVSQKRKIILVDSGAGNCYLSFLIYYYYQTIGKRDVEIHCIDYNERLMNNNRELARRLNFEHMHFYGCDINDFCMDQKVDVVYSLHACDTATDKTMYLGVRHQARIVLSVSCCQNTITMKNQRLKAVLRHKAFRDKTIMMISDSLRGLLMEQQGYKVDVFDFVSSRYTEKNTMIRSIRTNFKKHLDAKEEYRIVSEEFRMHPHLEELLANEPVRKELIAPAAEVAV